MYANGERLGEFSPDANVKGCKVGALSTTGKPSRGWHTAAGCFSVLRNGKALAADFGNSSNLPAEVEVTVRSRVFAPHKRGLAHIIVQGFIIEHGANQWIENFWFPQNAKYSQSGLLGTRSGFMWTIRNNTIRKAQTIALDIGVEGGYTGAWPPPDNEGTMQPTPNITGNHTVTENILEDNGASGIQGYVATGTVSFNIIRHNGAIGCAGAENAAVKTHGFEGVMEGNLIYGNSEVCRRCALICRSRRWLCLCCEMALRMVCALLRVRHRSCRFGLIAGTSTCDSLATLSSIISQVAMELDSNCPLALHWSTTTFSLAQAAERESQGWMPAALPMPIISSLGTTVAASQFMA